MKFKVLNRETQSETIGWTIATWFGSGLLPKAPGTMGSFCALPLVLGLFFGIQFFCLMILALFCIGLWATNIVLKGQSKQDPGFVVIDEVVGQLLTFALIPFTSLSLTYLLIGFALFRFFDIIKFWPASYFDSSVHNAFGVMMDDVIAGVYGALTLYIITFFI